MESDISGSDPTDAAAQLAVLTADRRALAERVRIYVAELRSAT